MKKRTHIRKEALSIMTELGVFDPYLPIDEVWVVYARLGHFTGWALVGAKTESSARRYVRKPETGWITSARITGVYSLRDSCEIKNVENLKQQGLYPKELGEWHELKWGI
jgi:hypothetical protein